MFGLRLPHSSLTAAALAFALVVCRDARTEEQSAPSAPPTAPAESVRITDAAIPAGENIVQELRVLGNRTKSTVKVLNEVGTRIGRPFDKEQLERDVRKLASKGWFLDVKPEVEHAPAGGLIITFKVIERPLLDYVIYVGNKKVKAKTLAKQTELKVGMARDPYLVEEGKRKLEQYYREKGFNDVQVTILEGSKTQDRGVKYLINEGLSKKVWNVEFEGNSPSIATDSRLKTVIQSKPPIFWIFKGFVDEKKIQEDVDRLTTYYRGLGFFRARISRELEWNEELNWLTLTFVIDEGTRYQVREIAFIGNEKFKSEQLNTDLKLKGGEFFDQNKMNHDLGSVRDIYGSVGYVFADVQAEPRFLEEPGKIDLVYNVEEGKRYRVGKINVKVEGEHPHTRQQAVLNRISLRPGDIIDIRQVRASERRLKASGLFLNDPSQGSAPKLVIVPPKLDDDAESIAERPKRDKVRGQSPDSSTYPGDVVVDLGVDGQLVEEQPAARRPLQPPPQTRQTTAKPPIIRGQSPGYRAESPPPIVRGQYNGPFGGQQTGPMGPPSNYQSAPPRRVQQSPVPGDDVFAPTQLQPGAAPAAPAQPYVPPQPGNPPPQQYAPPGGFGASPGAPPNALPPPPSQPGPLFGNIFGNPGVSPVDENGFAPPTLEEPDGYVDIDSVVQETQTGRFMFGVGVNSDAGLVGSIVVDEQNFDWRRWPTNGWEDFRNGTAFRGAGQRFRMEAAPGTQVQRYLINFSEPYLFDTPVSLGLSAFYYTRLYTDWTEQRLGGKANLGYQFTPDLSGTVGFGGQEVNISNPRQPTPPDLAEVLGDTTLYTFSTQIQHDTRDNTFLPTEGHLIQFGFDQNFGSFVFPRFTANLRQFVALRERPDGSGRHVLSLIGQVGFSGSDTPLYERFFIGGFSTLRGFRFRGVGPTDMDVKVGGNFELLTSAEYMFPITADDMLRGVVFADAGTVEPTADLSQYRVAPGFGLRITVPALGPAPIALDFAFPVAFEPSDQRQVFSFFVGFGR